MRARALIAIAAALAGLAGGCTSEPRDEHRRLVVNSRGADEAYDALSQALTQRFDSIDPESTSREQRTIVTVWRPQDEPNRLVRKRASGTVRPRGDAEAVVEVKVERQLSTKKTSYGELDKQAPAWIGGSDLADTTLEREILLAVKGRTKGRIEGEE